MYINSLDDLRRVVLDQVENFSDLSQYSLPFDDLVDSGTDSLLVLLRTCYDFSWGMELPELEDDVIEHLLRDYEKA